MCVFGFNYHWEIFSNVYQCVGVCFKMKFPKTTIFFSFHNRDIKFSRCSIIFGVKNHGKRFCFSPLSIYWVKMMHQLKNEGVTLLLFIDLDIDIFFTKSKNI